jgi:heat shock protein HslJ
MRPTVLILLTVVAFAACGSGESDGSGAGSSGGELKGRTFLSRAVAGHDLVEGTELRVTFNADGTLSASAGCNQFVGELVIDGDSLVVTNLGGTEMGCDEARHAQDEWFTGLLSDRPAYRLSGSDLTLTQGDVSIELVDRKVADPDLPLVGTRWVVDTILEGDAASSVPQGVEAWVTFGADGKVSGHDGCNGFGGTYEAGDDEVTIRERVQTLIGCTGEIERLSNAVGAATDGTVTYEINAKRLTLTDADGRGVSAVGGSA